MSELKAYSQCYDGTDGLFYLKSEVDKVIARQKYKRCLAMAKICENKLGTVVKPGWWDRWRKRWIELAKKFKEVK